METNAESEEVVVQVAGSYAIVVGATAETESSSWGRWISELTSCEVASVVRALDPASRALIEARRLTGGLVELDPASRAAWSTLKKFTEDGGWIQGVLRNDRGRFARLVRIRPATGLAALSGGSAVLGAIAAQAQAAEMVQDVKAIRQRVDEIHERLHIAQIGAVDNLVEQVDDLIKRLRLHGKDGIRESDFPVVKMRLGEVRHTCMGELESAIQKLEEVKTQGSPRQAEKSLGNDAVEGVTLYLDLLGKLYVASVRFGLAQVALEYHQGKMEVARSHAADAAKSATKFRSEIAAACGWLGQLDESIRSRLVTDAERKAWWTRASGGTALTAHAVVDKVAGTKMITVRISGTTIPIPLKTITTIGALLPAVGGGVYCMTQTIAVKKLYERLSQLTEASYRCVAHMDQAAGTLEEHRALTEELTTANMRPHSQLSST